MALVNSDGTVAGISPGYANIIAQSTDGSGITASCLIHVTEPIVLTEDLRFSNASVSIVKGDVAALTPIFIPNNVSNKKLIWSSSNTNCATVDNDGNVTALDYGFAVIRVATTDGTNLSAECFVTVCHQQDNTLFANSTYAYPKQKLKLPIEMKNTSNILGFQCDIELPEGLDIARDDNGYLFEWIDRTSERNPHVMSSNL